MIKRYRQQKTFTVKLACLVSLFMMAINLNAQETESLSWNDMINQALEENPNLASAGANLEASRVNIALARANYLPGMNVIGSLSQSKTATFSQTAGVIPSSSALVGASLSQMVYNENTLANFKIQKYLFASQEEQYRNSRYRTISAAGMSYIGLLFAIDLLDVQEQNFKITEQNLNASLDQLEVGSTGQRQVLRWEAQKYSNEQVVESQKATVIIKRGELNQLRNLPIETSCYPEKLSIEKDGFIFSSEVVAVTAKDEEKAIIIRDYLVELGLANSPVLASIDQQLYALDRMLKANKRWAIPNFEATAAADAKFDLNKEESEELGEDTGFWKFGLSMYLPLVEGGANIKKVKQSRWQISAMEMQKNNIKTSIEQSIRSSVAVVISDFNNIQSAKSQAEAAQQNYDLVYDSYYAGESTLLDLVDAQEIKLVADISSRVTLYTFFSDLLAVEQAIGYFPFLEPEENVQEIISELERRLIFTQ